MRKRISPSVAISLAALFFSLTGAGLAAGRYLITSKSQIAPWVRAELRGARGPRGSQGATGAQGAAGATGPVGSVIAGNLVAVESRPVDVERGQTITTSVQCPRTATAVTGTLHDDSSAPTTLAITAASEPDGPLGRNGNGWRITVTNNGALPASVQVIAVCAS